MDEDKVERIVVRGEEMEVLMKGEGREKSEVERVCVGVRGREEGVDGIGGLLRYGFCDDGMGGGMYGRGVGVEKEREEI